MHIAQKVREQDGRESLDDSSLLWPYLYHFYIILGSAPTVGGGGISETLNLRQSCMRRTGEPIAGPKV